MLRNGTLTAMILCLMFGLLPLSAAQAASYVIELKNGRQFTTERYWTEGDQVKFQTLGGTLGFSKDAVQEIREVKTEAYEQVTPVTPEASQQQEPQRRDAAVSPTVQEQKPASTSAAAGMPEPATGEAGKSEETDDFAYYRQKRQELEAKIDEHVGKFLEASGKNDAAGKQKARQQYLEDSKQLFQLQEELKEKNHGELPEWWRKI
jgi:hypothetical protein